LRIGILGGTFDPPHLGHINAAKKAIHDLCLDKLIIMPAFTSPFKLGRVMTPPPVRIAMCIAAFGSLSKAIEISDFEISRHEISYTINTVCHLKKLYPSADLYLIAGSDVPKNFDKWKDSDRLRKLVNLYIIPRELVPVSSSEIREKIKNNEDPSGLITPEVLEIIRKHNIYND
jgi:nicotinate-nucleotide adenylyltransferase